LKRSIPFKQVSFVPWIRSYRKTLEERRKGFCSRCRTKAAQKAYSHINHSHH